VNALPAVPPHPEESPKTFKRKTSLVELVLVSADHTLFLRPVTQRGHIDQSSTGCSISHGTQGQRIGLSPSPSVIQLNFLDSFRPSSIHAFHITRSTTIYIDAAATSQTHRSTHCSLSIYNFVHYDH